MPKNNPSAGSMLRLLWDVPGMSEAFAPPEDATADASTEIAAAEIAEESVATRTPTLLRRLPEEYEAPALPAPLEWTHPPREAAAVAHTFAWASDLRRQVGVVTHAYLQRIANDGMKDWAEMETWDEARVLGLRAEIARALDAEGALGEELERGADEVAEALRYAISSERGRWKAVSNAFAWTEPSSRTARAGWWTTRSPGAKAATRRASCDYRRKSTALTCSATSAYCASGMSVRCVARCSSHFWEPSVRLCSAEIEIHRSETLARPPGLH
jgi:hypothetical protein